MKSKQKIIAVVGPTAVGKTDVAIFLANNFNGEIISADSRQIYKGMDIGTGKVTREELKGIPYHLIDILNPGESYSSSQFKKEAEELIEEIIDRDKLPIIEGGTGFYISSITEGVDFPKVETNEELRNELEKKNEKELFQILKRLDKERAEEIDKDNKVRLIRAIEITKVLGKVPDVKRRPKYNSLIIGIDLDDENLKERINERIEKRLKNGMIREVKNLLNQGVKKEWLDKIGLEYRYISRFLGGKIDKDEMIMELENKSWQYAKRQRTWFRKDKKIKWFFPADVQKIESTVESFIGGR